MRGQGVAGVDMLLVIGALIAAAMGGLSLSNATEGVGFLAGACLLAIFARMAQSSRQHRDIMRTLRAGLSVPILPPDPPRDDRWPCACGYRNTPNVFDCTRCGAPRPRS
jgi:hypothetical protein